MRYAAVATIALSFAVGCTAGKRAPATQATVAAPKEAQEYLSLVDAGRLSEAWDMSSPSLRACSATGDALDTFLRKRRDLFGDLQSRGLRSVRERKRISGLPKVKDGRYVELRYDASYSRMAKAEDLLILWPDEHGSYRIARYCTESIGVDAK